MSYYQTLCERGHETRGDVCQVERPDPQQFICDVPGCGRGLAWWNSVHTMLGSLHINLQEKTPTKWCACGMCGTRHVAEPETFHIPEAGGHRV